MTPFKAGIVQFDVALGRVDDNVDAVMAGLDDLERHGVTLALLPEMWSCGFDLDHLAGHAQHSPGLLDRLGRVAVKKKMAVAGTLPENIGGKVANTFYLIDATGRTRVAYRKIHLFRPGSEHRHFQAGNTMVLGALPFGRMGLITCYDLRFPELSRALTLAGAHCLLVAAQWPRSRSEHWEVLLRARAIENQVFVIAANRCGSDPHLDYGGGSRIITPWGEALATAGDQAEQIWAAIDPQVLERAREAVPCLTDRRPEVYRDGPL